MRKTPSVFVCDYSKRGETPARDEVTPGCEWVLAGEGVATRKWDGSCVLVRGGVLLARYDAKHGKTPPANFEPAQPEADPITGHWPGWVPTDGPQHKWHVHAFLQSGGAGLPDGTYEAVGPAFQGNPERLEHNELRRHGGEVHFLVPRTFEGLREYLRGKDIEGLVFHHPDGRMAKVRLDQFGLKRGVL